MSDKIYTLILEGRDTLRVSGRLDFSNVVRATEDGRVLLARMDDIMIDLAGLTFADSSSLALLIEWIRFARKSSKKILLKNIPQRLLDLGRVSGLDAVLPLHKPLGS